MNVLGVEVFGLSSGSVHGLGCLDSGTILESDSGEGHKVGTLWHWPVKVI